MCISDNRGMIFITSLAAMVILLTIATGYLFISRTQLDIGTNQRDALRAFYISQAGIEKACSKIKADPDWRDGFSSEGFGGGNYTVTALDISGGIRLTSVGRYAGAKRTIVQDLAITYGSDFGYASLTGSDIAFNNGTTGSIKNGNVHGNNNVDLGGVNLDDGYSATQGTEENIPTVSFSDYRAAALAADPSKVKTSNFTFTAAGSPYSGLWFIEGKAAIESGVAINGTVIAYGSTGQNGNIDMQNNSNITITPAGNYPAIIAENQILLNGASNIEITGLIYGEKDLNLNGCDNFTLNNGAIVIKQDIQANSQTTGLDITYSSSLNPPYFTIAGSPTGMTSTISASSWKGHP
jgi:hypothetical protein